ncbi:class I tRNA ligase family protein, partial [bacterium]|nr:class I tRNA ligase family protein [bacterium]
VSDAIPPLAGKPVFVVIWTTTPWTIPANLAIAMHPEYDYCAVQVNDQVLIVAEGLKDQFLNANELSGETIATFKAGLL